MHKPSTVLGELIQGNVKRFGKPMISHAVCMYVYLGSHGNKRKEDPWKTEAQKSPAINEAL